MEDNEAAVAAQIDAACNDIAALSKTLEELPQDSPQRIGLMDDITMLSRRITVLTDDNERAA